MRLFISKTYIAGLVILSGCIFVSLDFWFAGGGYRAVSPLVFILGCLGFVLIVTKRAEPFWRLLTTPALPLQKKLLWRRQIPQLVTGLYINHIAQYPDWKTISPDFIPTSVTAAIKSDNKIKIILYFNEYDFAFNEQAEQALLEIFTGGKKVFGLILSQHMADYAPTWEPAEIQTFVPGPWISAFIRLRAEVVAIIKERAREARES